MCIRIIAIYAVIGAFGIGFTAFTGASACVFLNITGRPCPSCGMAHGLLALLALDFEAAFNYHPLVLVPVILPALYITVNGRYILSDRVRAVLITFMAFAIIVLWVIRLFVIF